MSDDFTPPPAGEPVSHLCPSDVGAAMLPTPVADDVEYADVLDAESPATGARTASAPKPPTGDQVIAYAMTQRGSTGHERENVNKYTRWYYGDGTDASWCSIFVCYCYNHFGALGLLNGKVAYVPNLKAHVGSKWHTDRKLISKGDPVTFDFNRSGEPEHVGMFVKWLDSSHTLFESIEGNTGDDVVATRTRRWSDVFGFVKPGLASSSDPSKYTGTIYAYKPGRPAQSSAHVKWAQERLNGHGAKLKTDGQYGKLTAAAVKTFQKASGLEADGKIGPKTWAALAK